MKMLGLVRTPGGVIALIVVGAAYMVLTRHLLDASVQVIPAGETGSVKSGSLTFEIVTVEQQLDGVLVTARITNNGTERIGSANGTCLAKDGSNKSLIRDNRQIISPDKGLAPQGIQLQEFFLWGLYEEDIAFYTFYSSSVTFI